MVIKGEEKIITSADNRNIELTENSKQKGEKVTCHIICQHWKMDAENWA